MGNNGLLDDTVAKIAAEGLLVKQVVVRQGGALLAHRLLEPEDRPNVWSVSKTFTAVAAGFAVQEGLFRLDSRFSEFFPGVASSPGAAVTVDDALSMKTGHGACPIEERMRAGQPVGDILEQFFSTPLRWPHGTHWCYDNSGYYMLSRLIERTAGVPLPDYLTPRLFRPLGMDTPKWDRCPLGFSQGMAGIHLNAREIALVGEVLLHDGAGLIPGDFVRSMKEKQTDNSGNPSAFATADHRSGYGYGLWMCRYPGVVRMDGMYGNYCVLLPDRDAVVCFVSREPVRMSAVLELVWDTLMEKL